MEMERKRKLKLSGGARKKLHAFKRATAGTLDIRAAFQNSTGREDELNTSSAHIYSETENTTTLSLAPDPAKIDLDQEFGSPSAKLFKISKLSVSEPEASTSGTALEITVPSHCTLAPHFQTPDLEAEDSEAYVHVCKIVQTEAEALEDDSFAGEYLSDPVLYKNVVITPKLVRSLITIGPCQPGVNEKFYFPEEILLHGTCKGKRFLTDWYCSRTAWLMYSPRANKMFCFSCVLFRTKQGSCSWSDPNRGVGNFRKGLEKIKFHESSTSHKESLNTLFLTTYRINKDKTVANEQLSAMKEEREQNRKVVSIILDCILFLARQGLPLRGHLENNNSDNGGNRGNFLELITFLSKYEATLATHLHTQVGTKTMYLSPGIQNEFIHALSIFCTKAIVSEIQESTFFSIIVDSTIDISRSDQFSLSIRYVGNDGFARERFLLFDALPGSSAKDFFNTLMINLNKLKLNIKFCRGQAYDGAATMSGHVSGLQQRVKEKQPNAVYIHCLAHNLNLVLIDAISSCLKVKCFFGNLEIIYTFLTSSLPRLDLLKKEQREKVENVKSKLTLKRLSDTRWYSHKHALIAIIQSLSAILSTLNLISEGTISNTAAKTMSESMGLLNQISNFEFLILLIFWEDILTKIDVCSKYLQKVDLDLTTASAMVKSVQNELANLRCDEAFLIIENKAKLLAEQCDISTVYEKPRVRRQKKHFDERARDEPIEDSRQSFKIEVYHVVLDHLHTQFNERFEDFHRVSSTFSCLKPVNFYEENSIKAVMDLALAYEEDLDEMSSTVDEYKLFRNLYTQIFTTKEENLKINQVLNFMYVNNMTDSFKNLNILYKIFLTLPISSASAERSFSRLKQIKSYLRSTMSELRLSDLAILNIEREFSNNIDLNKVIDLFKNVKHRNLLL